MKIDTNELSHILSMAALPIYGKNLKKIFSRTTRPKMFAFGLYTQVSDSGHHGPLVLLYHLSLASFSNRITMGYLPKTPAP